MIFKKENEVTPDWQIATNEQIHSNHWVYNVKIREN
jgi:hypothetical protein